MSITANEEKFITQYDEISRIKNQLACSDDQANRLVKHAETIRAQNTLIREFLRQKQANASADFFQLLLTTPARRFIKFLEFL